MDTLESIGLRRAVKHYDPDFIMPESDVDKLLESAILSPTSFNIQNWRFVLVEDPEIRQKIREVAWDQAQITEASLLFVLCADVKAWEKEPERYWRNAPQNIQNILVPMIGSFYEGREQLQRDEAIRSVGIVSQTIMLAAKSMGYDSCPMIGFDSEKVAEIINLPSDHVIGMLLSVGKAIKPAQNRGGQLPLSDVLIKNQF